LTFLPFFALPQGHNKTIFICGQLTAFPERRRASTVFDKELNFCI
jgi:hypothetical protein